MKTKAWNFRLVFDIGLFLISLSLLILCLLLSFIFRPPCFRLFSFLLISSVWLLCMIRDFFFLLSLLYIKHCMLKLFYAYCLLTSFLLILYLILFDFFPVHALFSLFLTPCLVFYFVSLILQKVITKTLWKTRLVSHKLFNGEYLNFFNKIFIIFLNYI